MPARQRKQTSKSESPDAGELPGRESETGAESETVESETVTTGEVGNSKGFRLVPTDSECERALRLVKGNISEAARRIGCARQTLYDHIQRSEALQKVQREIRESHLDLLETTLASMAVDERNTAAVIFSLKTIGRDRGYSETPIMLAPPTINVAVIPDWRRPDAAQVVIETPSQPELPPGDD